MWFFPSDPDPHDEATLRLRLAVAATIAGFALVIVGFALLVPAGQEPAMRVIGGALMLVGGATLAKVLAWARQWRWTYDRPPRDGLSAGETFVIATVVVIACGGLYPLVGPWFLLGFLAIPAAAILRRVLRTRRPTTSVPKQP